jgi:RND family efflux transporter MFP subunit
VRRLGPTGFVSRQDLDNANEGLRSAQADYRRTLALQAYEVLRAPFAGIVTQRNVDPGALVSASSTAPLLQIADPKRLRVWVYVAQDVAPYLHAGDPADIAADERPGHLLHAQVSRIAEALDSRTRTMLAEVWLDNSEGSLVSGVFVHVTLHVRIPPLPVVPSNAILSRGEKTLVAVVVAQDKLHLTPVETGLDDGKMVQVRTGLRGNETVALDVPSELGEGAVIQPLQPGQVKKGGQPQAREGTPPKRDGKQAKDGKGNAQQDGKDGNQGR